MSTTKQPHDAASSSTGRRNGAAPSCTTALRTLATALVLAATLAASAQASEMPNDRGGLLGVGGVSQPAPIPDAFERAVNVHMANRPDAFGRVVAAHASANATRPDDRGGMLGVGAVSVTPLVAPDAFDRAVANHLNSAPTRPDDRTGAHGPGPGAIAPNVAATTATDTSSGFQWSDASMGAGAMLGALLLAAAVAITIRRSSTLAS